MPDVIDNGDGGAEAAAVAADDALDPKVVSRRDALKKAAIGAGIAGAVWSAPRIEGLSLVPDYAAAGTIPPGSTILIKATSADCSPSVLNNTNCWGNCVPVPPGPFGVPMASTCAPFQFKAPAYAPAMATGTAPGGTASVYNSTTMLPAPAPPGPNQNEIFDVVWSGLADNNATGMAGLMFMLDPPFNMCAVTAVQGQVYNVINNRSGWPAPGLMFTNHTPPGSPVAVGADVSFTPPVINQGADVTITITCT